MTPTRKRRLIAVALILGAVGIATALTVTALSQNMTYLFSPSETLAGHAPPGASFKLGGVVLEHSIQRDPNSLKVDFVVTDRFKQVPVEYTGILPDLFREGQSVIATGKMQGDRFVAREVLAKHDETYMPKEVADAIAKAKATQGTPAPR
ncbi:MAG: cytochrome c maturation protein CcmE [Rudaea sp.]|uniref:cytochrome c maturation protein CcmE n=1 Tax=unclassified Rudaea TaxID=2627037 RepID=UPI0010F9FED3|nr:MULTISPECIES: cytochrome c maturation protein CcmE [unclassified Rudaea]MBN8884666.1 cytochrome c maturation protein CcmE [Rudaea sp.]MBR0343884.1 cytochrome c maturation protein CcmE [Rudaea sp.]